MIVQSNSDTTAYIEIICKRGDGFNRRFLFLQNDNPEDLTGCSFQMTVVRSFDAFKTPVLSLSGMIDENAVSFSAGPEMMGIPCGRYSYDIQQNYADEGVRTRVGGFFTIHNDVTE